MNLTPDDLFETMFEDVDVIAEAMQAFNLAATRREDAMQLYNAAMFHKERSSAAAAAMQVHVLTEQATTATTIMIGSLEELQVTVDELLQAMRSLEGSIKPRITLAA